MTEIEKNQKSENLSTQSSTREGVELLELKETRELLKIAETRITSQMNFISVFLTLAAFVVAVLVVKQYFSAQEIKQIKEDLDKHVDKKINFFLEQDKQKRISTNLSIYLKNDHFYGDHKASSFQVITEGRSLSRSGFDLITNKMYSLINDYNNDNKVDIFNKITWLTYVLSFSKPTEAISSLFKAVLNIELSSSIDPNTERASHSIMRYYLQDIDGFKKDIIDLINDEANSYTGNLHCAYLLAEKYNSKEIAQTIVKLFSRIPHRLNNFANDKASIDLFLESNWESVIERDGRIKATNHLLKDKSHSNQQVNLRSSEGSYLSSKLQALIDN